MVMSGSANSCVPGLMKPPATEMRKTRSPGPVLCEVPGEPLGVGDGVGAGVSEGVDDGVAEGAAVGAEVGVGAEDGAAVAVGGGDALGAAVGRVALHAAARRITVA